MAMPGFLPGGQNLRNWVFQDAGYRYLWADNPAMVLKLSFENVLSKGKGQITGSGLALSDRWKA